jgi:hypothetical protein
MDPELLSEKVPAIVAWVDDLIARHASDSRPLTGFGLRRLPAYFDADLLGRARVVVVDSLPIPPLSNVGLDGFRDFEQGIAHGITYRDTCFVVPSRQGDERLHCHELVHMLQWEMLGTEQFVKVYTTGLARYGYEDNPLEQIAYAIDTEFNRPGRPFAAAPRVRAHLDEVVPALLAPSGV